MNKKNELNSIKNKISSVLKEHKVTRAGIFGSFARGEQKKKSDVDILVELDIDYDLFDIARLKSLIERKLKRKVDLVEYECIRKEIKDNILRDEIPIIR